MLSVLKSGRENLRLAATIASILRRSKETYGAPMIRAELADAHLHGEPGRGFETIFRSLLEPTNLATQSTKLVTLHRRQLTNAMQVSRFA